MYTIPVVDIRANDLGQLVRDCPERTHELIETSRYTPGFFQDRSVVLFCHQVTESPVVG